MARKTAEWLGSEHNAKQNKPPSGYLKGCCWRVTHLTFDKYKRVHSDTASQLLGTHAAKGDDFLLNIANGHESWFHHFHPKNKAWKDTMLYPHRRRRPQSCPQPMKVQEYNDWDTQIFIMVASMHKGRNYKCHSLYSDAPETVICTL
jgi:hypothetical protein